LFPEWSVGANTLGGVVSLLAMMFGNWYLWTRWRSYRLEKKVAAAYQKKHDPWYTKTGDERPKGPIKNKYYEP
jgi:hypothetical protein